MTNSHSRMRYSGRREFCLANKNRGKLEAPVESWNRATNRKFSPPRDPRRFRRGTATFSAADHRDRVTAAWCRCEITLLLVLSSFRQAGHERPTLTAITNAQLVAGTARGIPESGARARRYSHSRGPAGRRLPLCGSSCLPGSPYRNTRAHCRGPNGRKSPDNRLPPHSGTWERNDFGGCTLLYSRADRATNVDHLDVQTTGYTEDVYRELKSSPFLFSAFVTPTGWRGPRRRRGCNSIRGLTLAEA